MPAPDDTPTLSLVLPTYNERQNLPLVIGRVVETLEAADRTFEIIVVDDDSPDGTWALAEQMATDDPRVRVIRRRGERGLATAVVSGWNRARGAVLGVMDADLQYPPESLPDLLKALDDPRVDIAVASRYAPGATVEHWDLSRWIISRGARLIGRLALPAALGRIADPGAGYFLMRRDVVQAAQLRPRGFKILIEVLARGRYEGVVEIGLSYRGRQQGHSKLRSRQVLDYLSHLGELSRDTGELSRSLRRATIQLLGMFVNLGLLWALIDRAGWHYLPAAALAVEGAILTTFLWARRLGAGEPRPAHPGPWPYLKSSLSWHLRRAPGALLNIGTVCALTGGLEAPYLQGAVLAVVVDAVTTSLTRTWWRQPALSAPVRPASVVSSKISISA